MAGRTVIVGDIHGCLDELNDLLDKIAFNKSVDKFISVGDVLDRGPNSAGVIERIWDIGGNITIGNHEDKHLNVKDGKYGPTPRLAKHHHETIRQLKDKHYDYLRTLPLFIRIPEHNVVVVHAGVLPNIRIEDQPPNILMRCQHIKPPDTRTYWPNRAPAGYQFWTQLYKGPERVIFGHSHMKDVMVREHVIGLDTGCVHGRMLSAVVLPDFEIVQVQARRVYHTSSKGDTHDDIKEYKVDDTSITYS